MNREQIVIEALETLTPREKDILQKRYGIGMERITVKEIAEHYSLTAARIRQIEARAVRKLRFPSRSRLLRPLVSPFPGVDALLLRAFQRFQDR